MAMIVVSNNRAFWNSATNDQMYVCAILVTM